MKAFFFEFAKILFHKRHPALLLVVVFTLITSGFSSTAPVESGFRASESGFGQGLIGDTLDIIVDAAGKQVEITAYWKRLSEEEVVGAYSSSVLSDDGLNADSDVRFIPEFTTGGEFDVYLYWPSLRDPNRKLATDLRVTVRHAAGEKRFRINQQENPGVWYPLGRFTFEPGKPGHIQLITDEAHGVVLADAVGFRLAGTPVE